MKKDGYYSSGTFAAMAHVTKKTLRYYDENNILKPSFVDEKGVKYYSDNDFAKLQQIIFLKYLSFPLADIKALTVRNDDRDFWMESLAMQESLVEGHIEQLQVMKKTLQDAIEAIKEGKKVSWSEMLHLANTNEMEERLKQQYMNSSNITARINLHEKYSENKEGWFRWLYRMADIEPGERVLELGCGDGSFWKQNLDHIPDGLDITISDISDGIVHETSRTLKIQNCNVAFNVIDAQIIAEKDRSFDIVIANHMLFYCDDLAKVLSEIKRVLKPGGRLVCSTYSSEHMKEISELVQSFDDRIVLSADKLYEKFGKENGKEILSCFFSDISWKQFEDSLCVTSPEPLIAYIMSCHGNQNRFIVDKYHEFYSFVQKCVDTGFFITKDAGTFISWL